MYIMQYIMVDGTVRPLSIPRFLSRLSADRLDHITQQRPIGRVYDISRPRFLFSFLVETTDIACVDGYLLVFDCCVAWYS
jgi:hypothetical protein